MSSVKVVPSSIRLQGKTVQIIDLTHPLTERFNLTPQAKRISLEPMKGSGAAAGMRLNRLTVVEHTGTHIDAPSHFDEHGASVGDLPVGDLVVPLVVVDISSRVAKDRNALLLPEDVEAWEAHHGPLPDNCCVALHARWDVLDQIENPSMTLHERIRSPGFSPEATQMLVDRGNVRGIGVETLTIDAGCNCPAYPVHQIWLKDGRWGLEGLTNLDRVPASGAVLIVGAAPVAGATGIPVRALAMF